jgi:hypothetical protein
MNNRYNYNSNRKRNYNTRNSGSGIAGFIATLIGVIIILGIWVISLKSDINHLSDDKLLLMLEKNEIKHKMDSITKTLQIPVKEVVVEKKSKIPSNNKVFKNKSEKDTIKIKVEKIENKPILVDSTGL